jgi:hypothetical protein
MIIILMLACGVLQYIKFYDLLRNLSFSLGTTIYSLLSEDFRRLEFSSAPLCKPKVSILAFSNVYIVCMYFKWKVCTFLKVRFDALIVILRSQVLLTSVIVPIPGTLHIYNFIVALAISLFEMRGSHSGTVEDSILMVYYSMSLDK